MKSCMASLLVSSKMLSGLLLLGAPPGLAPLASAAPGATASFILISVFVMRSYSPNMYSSGMSAPSSIPRLLRTNSAFVIFCFTPGLCASVLSMMML